MKKNAFITTVAALLFGSASALFAVENPFTVTSQSVAQNMVANSSQTINLLLTTKVAAPGAVTVHCAFKSDNPKLTASFNNSGCTSTGGIGINSTLPATVQVTYKVAASATGTMTGVVTFTQTNGRSSPQTYSLPVTIQPTARTIQFRNFCPQSVWFGVSSSSVPAKNTNSIACTTNSDCSAYTYSQCVNGFCGGGACASDSQCLNNHAGTCTVPPGSGPGTTATCTYCAADSDCIDGAKCNTTNHQCFWINPAPTDAAANHYELVAPSGGVIASNTVTLPDHSAQNGFALQWGGGFAARTGCTFGGGKLTCKTADCNVNGIGDGNGGCDLGEGFLAPSASAEATFVVLTPDTYDITVINGVNVPVSMRPTAGNAASPQAYKNAYLCGSPGGTSNITTSTGTLGGCSWNFVPPAIGFRWVDTDNATNCSSDSTCTGIDSSFRCGLTSTAIGTSGAGSAQATCGTPLGYWNQNEICATNATYNQSGIVNCTLSNVGGSGNSVINLLACTGSAAVSCFNISSASTTCCGCTNWQTQGIQVPTNPNIVQQCEFPNANWGAGATPSATGAVLPDLIWLKQACPSAYVYPFDDKSSTFTCPSNDGQSGVDYTIDFCPPVDL